MAKPFHFIVEQLKSPFPGYMDFKKSLVSNIPIALFIAGFLYLFRPFGLDSHTGPLLLMCMGYGLVTYLVSLLYEAFQIYILKLDKESPSWTLGKWILNVLLLILLISIGNYFYTFGLSNAGVVNWRQLLFFIKYTMLVGIFPIVISGLLTQIRNQRKNVQTALELSQTERIHKTHENKYLVNIVSQNEGEDLIFESNQLLYFEAIENYVGIHYFENEKAHKKMVRSTLKSIKDLLPTNSFIQCHRSFIVNFELVGKIEGNAQGLKLGFNGLPDRTIPVSRKYIPEFRDKIS